LYCLSFCLLAIVLSVLLSFCCVPHNQQLLIFEGLYPREGENRSFSSLDGWVFDSLIITKRTSLSERGYPTENTMAKRQKDRQYNGQKTEGQTTQWPKDRRTDNTMAKRQKDRQYKTGHTYGM
jgi:hypothetical protein